MEQSKTDQEIANDVLHNDDHSKLTPEEIAKAIAHHNKHHKEDGQQKAQAKGQLGKKQGGNKPK
jgi:hypothetical protein